MKLTTISEVSKTYDVTTRTLRYYEEIGLLTSKRKEDYAYRVYDKEAVSRLQIILMLRKLSISLKDIQVILGSNSPDQFIKLLEKRLDDVNQEIESLSNVKEVVHLFLHHVSEYQKIEYDIHSLNVFNDVSIVEKLQSNALNPKMLKEKKTMSEVKKKIEDPKLTNVRIIHIPPMTIASSHCEPCKEPEGIAKEMLFEFIKASKLSEKKPDYRVFGFNNPNEDEKGVHGYEFWVTIPEVMEVKKPLIKKTFEGGLYAAHSIKMGDFHEWKLLSGWMKNTEEFAFDYREPYGMDGCMEEELNAFNNYANNLIECAQLDLLIPVKRI